MNPTKFISVIMVDVKRETLLDPARSKFGHDDLIAWHVPMPFTEITFIFLPCCIAI